MELLEQKRTGEGAKIGKKYRSPFPCAVLLGTNHPAGAARGGSQTCSAVRVQPSCYQRSH